MGKVLWTYILGATEMRMAFASQELSADSDLFLSNKTFKKNVRGILRHGKAFEANRISYIILPLRFDALLSSS
uniref:AlNc14C52G4071 protein n=1 Tax=Albugo laibachii Nc14 TaxID=890382 RepID=F0WBM6_9STRA|nr:AlNc14C52G4071 [Albugo laibachii Nc14]|eukprot:CCA18553.1 AlNc14C52G4071 [Albugo laibachii Nc14]